MSAHIHYVVIDCADPEGLAEFWSELLGLEIGGRFGEGRYVFLTRTSQDAPSVAFQRVPEAKTVKNRVHLDCTVPDLEAATQWAESRGAHRGGDHDEDGYSWRVMLDPEGNEFCLVPEPQS